MINVRNVILCLTAFVFCSTSVYPWLPDFSWYNLQRVGQFVMIFFAAILTLIYVRKLPISLFLMIVSVLILGMASTALSSFPLWAAIEFFRFVGLMLLVIAISESAKNKIVFNFFIALLVFSSAVIAWMFIVYYCVALTVRTGAVDAYLLLYGFGNPRFLGQFQVIALPVLMAVMMKLAGVRSRWTYAVGIVVLFNWCLSFSLAGRGMLAALLLSHLSILFFVGNDVKKFLGGQLVFAAMGFLLSYLLLLVVPEWLGLKVSLHTVMRAGLSAREVLWGHALDMIASHPWLGVGPLHYSSVWNHIGAHPHQAILQWAAEWGIPAAILVIGLAAWGCCYSFNYLRKGKVSVIDVALWAGIISSLLLAQVDGVFVVPYTEGWLAIVIGLAWARWGKTVSNCKWGAGVFRVMAFGVILVIGGAFYFDVPNISNRQRLFHEVNQIGSPPRLWEQGWIPM